MNPSSDIWIYHCDHRKWSDLKLSAHFIAYCVLAYSRASFSNTYKCMYGTLNFLSTKRFNMNLFFSLQDQMSYTLIHITGIAHTSNPQDLSQQWESRCNTHNNKQVEHKRLGNKNLYRSATENKRNKTKSDQNHCTTYKRLETTCPQVLQDFEGVSTFEDSPFVSIPFILQACLESCYLTGKSKL